jgi:hypothetical protein
VPPSIYSGSRPLTIELLLVQCDETTLVQVRLLAILLIALLLPLGMSTPSVTACSASACCGASCPSNAPVNQVSCCQAPAATDRATNQAPAVEHFESIGMLTATASIILISNVRRTAISDRYIAPGPPLSLALLCSRQI